jgi:hypothetical protein
VAPRRARRRDRDLDRGAPPARRAGRHLAHGGCKTDLVQRHGLEPRDDPAELLGRVTGDREGAGRDTLSRRDVAVLERGDGRIEHLRERGDMLDGPVVELLRDAVVAPHAPQGAARRRGGRCSIDHRLAERDGDRLGAGLRLELREDVAHVALHGLLRDEELLRDVGVRHAVGEELQDLSLALVRISCPSRPVASEGISAGSTKVSPAATFSIALSRVSCGASLST